MSGTGLAIVVVVMVLVVMAVAWICIVRARRTQRKSMIQKTVLHNGDTVEPPNRGHFGDNIQLLCPL